MKCFEIRSVVAASALCLLAACGGGAGVEDSPTTAAAMTMHGGGASAGPAPVADCEAEGCNRPRIIDGLAEQYRAGAIERAALQDEPAQAEISAEPTPIEAAPASAGHVQ